MVNVDLKKHAFYLIGIILFALVINLSSAYDDIIVRLKEPLFQQVFIATMILLYVYLYIIQKIYHDLFYSNSWILRINTVLRGPIFVLLSVGSILVIHVNILNLLLGQRNYGNVFSHGYFKEDFWFLCIPLLCYVIYIYRKPNMLLFSVPKITGVQIAKEEESLDVEIDVVNHLFSIDKDDPLLVLWRNSRVVNFVFEYFQQLIKQRRWDLDNDIPLWNVVILEKTEFITFGYFVNGEKWGFQQFDDAILSNPWLVKISQNCYINMLYVVDDLYRRRMVKVDLKDRDTMAKEVNCELVMLNEEIRSILETHTDANKLDTLLILTRRMKVNYKNFWNSTSLQELDESRLGDIVGSIHIKS